MSAELIPFAAGNYHYLRGGFQYSAAVVADRGYAIERVQLRQSLALAEGFALIERVLTAAGRPLTALCACELRSPAPMREPEFIAFNRRYIEPLQRWGLFENDRNPVARCNLIPALVPPPEPSLYAFCFTRPGGKDGRPDFVTSGAAECPDRPGYHEAIVRRGETSPDALAEKLAYALGDLQVRFDAMGLAWSDIAELNTYTMQPLEEPLWAQVAVARGLPKTIRHWVRPPVVDIEIELDARRVSGTRYLDTNAV